MVGAAGKVTTGEEPEPLEGGVAYEGVVGDGTLTGEDPEEEEEGGDGGDVE